MKYNIGDKVKVVKYGSIMHWSKGILKELGVGVPNNILRETATHYTFDPSPELVGQIGIVRESNTRGVYALEGIKGKTAWYNEDQLELVNKNPNVL